LKSPSLSTPEFKAFARRFFPFLQWWHRVDRGTLRFDTMAGLTCALVVQPQSVRFETIAGIPPEYDLYTAMIPAVIGALFGYSWHLASGAIAEIPPEHGTATCRNSKLHLFRECHDRLPHITTRTESL
jgi:hypothetical protein